MNELEILEKFGFSGLLLSILIVALKWLLPRYVRQIKSANDENRKLVEKLIESKEKSFERTLKIVAEVKDESKKNIENSIESNKDLLKRISQNIGRNNSGNQEILDLVRESGNKSENTIKELVDLNIALNTLLREKLTRIEGMLETLIAIQKRNGR